MGGGPGSSSSRRRHEAATGIADVLQTRGFPQVYQVDPGGALPRGLPPKCAERETELVSALPTRCCVEFVCPSLAMDWQPWHHLGAW